MALLLFAGCATVSKPVVKSETEIKAIGLFVSANRYIANLKMTGDVYLKVEKGWAKSRAAVLVSRPGSMRVTLLDPTGMAWFVATANSSSVSYSTADRKERKLIRRNSNLLIRIGPLKASPDHLARFIHPGIQEEWLKSGSLRVGPRKLRVRHGKESAELSFDADNRLVGALVRMENGAPLRFRYKYRPGALEVVINRKVRFEFRRTEEADSLPESVFEPIVAP